MAQIEHLPIYKAAYDCCLHLEQVVRKFSRYHKHSIGEDLRDGARRKQLGDGGHVQVGIEPYGGPRSPTNVELVREVVNLDGKLGRPIATPYQAAQIMRLPTYPASFRKPS